MVRDEELNRLVHYAKGHNIEVTFEPYVPFSMDAGYTDIETNDICIFTHPRLSKLDIILTLIHELGHALYHINNNNRVVDMNLYEAIDNEEEKKKYRRIVLNYERNSAKWWDVIYKDTDMKFDINKLYFHKEYDVWQYEYWYKNNKFPTKQQKMKKRMKLKQKYQIG